jgi:hypothetical protein
VSCSFDINAYTVTSQTLGDSSKEATCEKSRLSTRSIQEIPGGHLDDMARIDLDMLMIEGPSYLLPNMRAYPFLDVSLE